LHFQNFDAFFNSAIHTAVCTIISHILRKLYSGQRTTTVPFQLVNIIIEIFWPHIYIIETLP